MEHRRYTFLGASPAALSMFLEIVRAAENDFLSITIVKNMEADLSVPFTVPDCNVQLVDAQEWEPDDSKVYLGVNLVRSKSLVYQYFEESFRLNVANYGSLIHPWNGIASTAILRSGICINPGVAIGPYAELESFVTVNRNVSIGHHSRIGKFSTIHPGVNIAGYCQIGASVTVGMGVDVVDSVSIGDRSIIGAGSLVTKDIPEGVLAYGSPAKPIKTL